MKKKAITKEQRFLIGSKYVFNILTNEMNEGDFLVEKAEEDKAFLIIPFYLDNLNRSNLEYNYKVYEQTDYQKDKIKLLFRTYIGFSISKVEDLARKRGYNITFKEYDVDSDILIIECSSIEEKNDIFHVRSRHF